MINKIRRFFLRHRWQKHYEQSLGERARVEHILFDVANGKRDMLTRDECRTLGMRLGVPKEWR